VKLLRVMAKTAHSSEWVAIKLSIADVRLIAATNKNLEQLVREGKFRDDLFFD